MTLKQCLSFECCRCLYLRGVGRMALLPQKLLANILADDSEIVLQGILLFWRYFTFLWGLWLCHWWWICVKTHILYLTCRIIINISMSSPEQYIPRNMHTVFALLCFVVVIHWLIFPYPSGLLHWHCGNLTIAPVPAKQPWWIWINTSCEFIMNDCITTTKQSTTKPCAYFLGYTVLGS